MTDLDSDKYSHPEDWGAETGDMIPRVTVRDAEDAMLIVMALRTHMHARITELERQAKLPGADQYALSLQTIDETRIMTDLVSAIEVMPNTDTPSDSATNTEEK